MSFVERNKAWLLPLLALAAAGVVWMNLRSLKGSTSSEAEPRVAPAETASATVPSPAPAPSPAPLPVPAAAPHPSASGDLWGDLRWLEEPAPGLNDTTSILKGGRQPLEQGWWEALPRATFQRERWQTLQDPPAPRSPQGAAAASSLPTERPLPTLDFVILRPDAKEAWFGGHPYREGTSPNGGSYRILRIDENSVVLRSPLGDRTLTTHGKSKSTNAGPAAEPK